MVTREELQLRLLAITAAFWIILILIGIPFTIVEIRFSYLFSVVSPERQKWKEDINIVFMALIATFIYSFICFLCALIGTILLIVVIVKYPGTWKSVNQSTRIDYEKNERCCLFYKKSENLIFKDCPLVNLDDSYIRNDTCISEYNFVVCNKDDLRISDYNICSIVPKEDFPFQICSIVIGFILTIVYLSLTIAYLVVSFVGIPELSIKYLYLNPDQITDPLIQNESNL
ncbi:hypothetical protein EHI2019_001136700 [Entamoeba histolytica]